MFGLGMPTTGRDGERVFILRCCRDWPVHLVEGVHMNGRCGICGAVPVFVAEDFVRPDFVA
jgi:hypothetical protein